MAAPILFGNNTNSLIVGKITHIEGTAIAVTPDGTARSLKEGDLIYLNDVVRSVGTGESTIRFVNGAIYTMHGESSISLNTESLKSITAQAFPSDKEDHVQTGQNNAYHLNYSGKQGYVSSGFTTHACGYASHPDAHKAVGTVHCAQGFVTAVGANGAMRLLSAGDKVYAGDVIVTEANSTAKISGDNGTYDVSPGQSYTAGACAEYTSGSSSWWESDNFSINYVGGSGGVTSGFATNGSGGNSGDSGGGSGGPPLTQALADVSISVTHTPTDSVVSGATDSFVFTVTNFGPNAVFGATIINTLPIGLFSGLTITGLPAGAQFVNLNNGNFEILNFNIAAGQVIQFTLSGIPDTNLRAGSDTFNDFVSISLPPSVTDPNLSNNTASSSNSVTPEANLTLTNTDSGLSVVPGTSNTYTLTLTNSGPSSLTHVSIIDTLPTGITNVTAVSALPEGATFTDLGNGQIEWSNIIIASGQTITFQFTGTVDPSLPEGTNTFINTAQVFVPDGTTNTNAGNTATDTNSVNPQANMTITKTVDGQTSEVLNMGDVFTYTISLGNTGPSDAININVQDLLSNVSGITFNYASATVNVGTLSTAGGNLSWDISSVGVNGVDLPFSPTLSITGIVTSPLASINNTASVTATHSDSDSSTATIIVNADLSINKTVTAGNSVSPSAIGSVTVGAGEDVTFQLTAANSGGIAATNVVITDNLPSNFNLQNGTITPSVGTVSVNAGVLTWTIPSLAAGANATLTYTETTNAPSAIEVNPNTVSITSNQTNQYGDATPENNGYTSNVTVIPLQSLTITNSDGTTDVIPGTANTYTITITNNGPSTLTGGSVVDFLPIGFTVTSQTSSVAGTTFTNLGGGQVEWNGLNLASGATATFTITGNIDPNLTQGTYTNIAQVYSPAGQINTNPNYTATDTNNLNPTANLGITKTDATNSVDGTDGVFITQTNSTTGGVAIPGSNAPETYTIVVSNTGPSNISGIAVTDLFPAGFNNATWSTVISGGASITSGGTSGSGDINNIVNLPSGSSITYTVTGDIPADATSPLINTAHLTLPVGVTNTNSFESSTDIVSLQPEANLTITKTDGVTDVIPGTINTYTITVTNSGGPSDITNATVTDTLPAGFINVNSVGLPAGVSFHNLGNGTVEWTGLNLAVGQSIQLQLSGLVDPNLAAGTGTFTNSAEVDVQPGQVNTNAANNTASDTNNVTPQVDLSVTKNDGVTSVVPGTTDTYTITVSNSGPSNANGVTVTDTLPTGFINLTSVLLPPGVTFTDLGNGTVEWSGLNIASGQSIQLNLSGTVDPSLAAGTGTFVDVVSVSAPAGVTDTNATNDSYTDINDVTPQATLSIIKLVDGQSSETANLGQNVLFTIQVTNSGPSYATNVSVNDLLPAGLTFVNNIVPAGTTYDSNTGVWTIGTLANGASETLVIQAQVTTIGSDVPSSIDQTATVTADDASSASSTATVNVNADVGIEKTVSAGNTVNNPSNSVSVLAGENVTYQLTASNTGGNTANNVVVTDNLPANFTLNNTSFLLNNVPIAAGDLAANGIIISGNTITWNLSSLAAADNATLTYTETANSPANAEIDQNSATITSDETNQFGDATPANNSTSSDVTVNPLADLAISKTDGVTSVVPGTTNTYTITVSNNGPSDVSGASVLDTLPAGLINVSSSSLPAGVSFTTLQNGQVEWTGLNIASGSSVQLQLTGTIDQLLTAGSDTFVNSAEIIMPAGVTDLNTNDNTATDTNDVTPQPSLSIIKLVDGQASEVANLGQIVTYTIQVSNSGPSAATNVSVNDLLPAGLTFIGDVVPAGTSYNPNTGVWNIGTLNSGSSDTLIIVAQVGAIGNTVPSSISQTATVSADDATSASSTAVINVNADVGINKTVNAGDTVLPGAIGSVTVNAGQDVTYQLTASNSGGNTANNVVVTDNLPANFTLDNTSFLLNNVPIAAGDLAANGIVISGTTITWTLSSLAAATSATLTYTEKTDAPSVIQVDPNTVSITSNETTQYGDATPQDNGYTGNVTVIPLNNITITNTDGTTSVIPGTANTYTITVTNSGPSALTNGSIIDLLPAGFTVTGQTSSVGGVTFTNLGGGQVEWTGLNLASGATATFTLTGNIDPNLAQGTYVNIAQVSVPAGQINANAVYTATDTNNLNPTANLSVKITDSGNFQNGTYSPSNNDTTGGIAIPGTSTVWTIVVANDGPSNVTGVKFTDLMPAGISSNSWSAVLSNGASITSGGTSGTGDINNIISLASGSTITYTINANIAAGATATLHNTATLTMPVGVTDTNAFKSSTDTLALLPRSDITLTNTDGHTSVAAGSSDTYTITVKNNGPSNLTGVTIIDTLPVGFTNVTSPNLPNGVIFTNLNNGQVEWTILTLTSLQTLNLQLTGTIDTGLPAGTNTFTNTAQVFVPSGEVNTNASTIATDTNNVTPIASLDVLNLVNGKFEDTVVQGSIVLYTIEVTNNGAINATGVNVLDLLPSTGLTFLGNTVTTGSYNASTGIWNVGTVASGETETLTIEAIVKDTTTTTATVTANNAATDVGTAIINEITPYPLFLGIYDLSTGQIVNNNQNSLQMNVLNTNSNTNVSSPHNSENVVTNNNVNEGCHKYNINETQSAPANTDILKFESLIDGHDYVKQFKDASTGVVNIDNLLNKMHESEHGNKSKENNTNTTASNNSANDAQAASGSAYVPNDYSTQHPLNNEQHTQQMNHIA